MGDGHSCPPVGWETDEVDVGCRISAAGCRHRQHYGVSCMCPQWRVACTCSTPTWVEEVRGRTTPPHGGVEVEELWWRSGGGGVRVEELRWRSGGGGAGVERSSCSYLWRIHQVFKQERGKVLFSNPNCCRLFSKSLSHLGPHLRRLR